MSEPFFALEDRRGSASVLFFSAPYSFATIGGSKRYPDDVRRREVHSLCNKLLHIARGVVLGGGGGSRFGEWYPSLTLGPRKCTKDVRPMESRRAFEDEKVLIIGFVLKYFVCIVSHSHSPTCTYTLYHYTHVAFERVKDRSSTP